MIDLIVFRKYCIILLRTTIFSHETFLHSVTQGVRHAVKSINNQSEFFSNPSTTASEHKFDHWYDDVVTSKQGLDLRERSRGRREGCYGRGSGSTRTDSHWSVVVAETLSSSRGPVLGESHPFHHAQTSLTPNEVNEKYSTKRSIFLKRNIYLKTFSHISKDQVKTGQILTNEHTLHTIAYVCT